MILVPWGLFDAGPILQLLAIALVPAAMTVAVLRHQLLDIRLVLSRTVLYVLLTALVAAAYLALVTVATRRAGARGLGSSGDAVLATLVVAIAFHPVRVRLQRVVDRALYGDRSDPVRALSGWASGCAPATRATAPRRAGRGLRRAAAARTRRSCGTGRSARARASRSGVETVPLVYRGERSASWSSACGPGRRAGSRRPGRAGGAGRAAGRRRAGDRALRVAAALPGADRRGPRGGTPPVAPRPARRARPGADRHLVPGRRGGQPARRPTRRGPPNCWSRCGRRRPRRSTTSAGWCTTCARPRSTSWAWSGRCGSTPSSSAPARRRWTCTRRTTCRRCPPRSRWPPTGSGSRR